MRCNLLHLRQGRCIMRLQDDYMFAIDYVIVKGQSKTGEVVKTHPEDVSLADYIRSVYDQGLSNEQMARDWDKFNSK